MNQYLASFTHKEWLADLILTFEALEVEEAVAAAKSYAKLFGLDFVFMEDK